MHSQSISERRPTKEEETKYCNEESQVRYWVCTSFQLRHKFATVLHFLELLQSLGSTKPISPPGDKKFEATETHVVKLEIVCPCSLRWCSTL